MQRTGCDCSVPAHATVSAARWDDPAPARHQASAEVTIVTVMAGEEGWENAAQHAAGRAVVMAGR